MHKMRYISRMENKQCWIVRIDQGKPTEISEIFADKNYGKDRDKSLRAAKIFRDNRLSERTPTTSGRLRKKSISNKSGFIGIFPEYKETPHSAYKGWRASFYENGSQVHRSFASKEYGDCEAFRMACRERYQRTGELRQVKEFPDVPCEPDVPIIKCFESEEGKGE